MQLHCANRAVERISNLYCLISGCNGILCQARSCGCLSRFVRLTAYLPTTPQEPCIASCDQRQKLDWVRQPLVFDIDFQRENQEFREFRIH
jgi:hypothetical protein